jgi:hypothetical protein
MELRYSQHETVEALEDFGVALNSVNTPRGFVSGNAHVEKNGVSVVVYWGKDPTVGDWQRHRRVVKTLVESPEEAARILRRSVLRHAKIREMLHEAQRRIYIDQSISN